MKKVITIILAFAVFVLQVPAIGASTNSKIYIENVDYNILRTDNVLVPIKLDSLPITALNGEKGSYGGGIIFSTFDNTKLEYIGTKTGTMSSSKGNTIVWQLNEITLANQNGEIRLAFADDTADRSKSYGDGSYVANSMDTVLYLEFAVKQKTVDDKIPVNITRAEFAGNAMTGTTMPALIGGTSLDMTGGTINISATPTPTPTPNSITGGSGGSGANYTPTPTPTVAPIAKHISYIKGYPDKTFKSENGITRAETIAIISRLTEGFIAENDYTSKFVDVSKDSWYANYIGFIADKNIITGYSDGSFMPNGSITRAEFATIITRFKALDTETEKALPFSDTTGHWATKYLSAIYEKGYIIGYSDKTFKPDSNITRAEAVKIINVATGRIPNKDKINANLSKYQILFADVANTYWAYYDILEASIDHDIKDFHE